MAMDPISSADRLVILLRQKLLERSKASARGERMSKREEAAADPVSAVRALAGLEAADDNALRRALIQDLLADQLGNDLLNDAQFQQVVSRVAESIEADDEGARLLSQIVSDLRAS